MLQDAWLRFTPASLDALRTVLSEALVNAEFRAVYLERVIAPALSLPEPIFRALATAKRIAPTEPALLTRAISSAMMGFVVLRLLGDPWVLVHWDRIPEHLADLVLEGLLPAKSDAAP
jgi:hypothetical protein